MNVEQRKLAADSMQEYGEQYGDFFSTLNAELNGALAGGASTTSPAEAIANRQLLADLVGLLPVRISRYDSSERREGYRNKDDLAAHTPAELRFLQANSVWVREADYPQPVPDVVRFELKPYYVIGQKNISSQRMSVLLHAPKTGGKSKEVDAPLHELHVPRNAFTKARKKAESMATLPLTEDELNAVKTEDGFSLLPRFNDVPVKLMQSTRWERIGAIAGIYYSPLRVVNLGRYMWARTHNADIQAISDERLGDFSVLQHISHLLNVFGVLSQGIELAKGNGSLQPGGDQLPQEAE